MSSPFHNEAADRLLRAMRPPSDDGYSHSFLFGRPDTPIARRNLGASVRYQKREMIGAAHYIRQNGAPYLKYLDIGDVWSLLTEFVVEAYWVLAGECWPGMFEGSYFERVSASTRAAFAEALAASPLFAPRTSTVLFPLVTVRIQAGFQGDTFFFCAPDGLASALADPSADRWLDPGVFPPLKAPDMPVKSPVSWLGVRAPNVAVARKMRAGILGAVSLTPEPRQRHSFSGRSVFGGFFTVPGRSMNLGDAHTPPLMSDIVLGPDDIAWLTEVDRLLTSKARADRRRLFALEYFYRAWPLDEAARFPIFCMALDGVFGEANQATQAVIDGVRGLLGEHIDAARLRDLMTLRAAVIHGGAPDVYDSRKYGRYYETYLADPVFDLELVVGACLRVRLFGEQMPPYQDASADILAELQAQGRAPRDPYEGAILHPVSRQTPGLEPRRARHRP